MNESVEIGRLVLLIVLMTMFAAGYLWGRAS